MLRQKLTEILDELKKQDSSVTPYRIALETPGLDASQLRQALKGDRPFSDTMLEKLASSDYLKSKMKATLGKIPFNYERLRLWRMMDEYPEFSNLLEIDKDFEQVLSDVEELNEHKRTGALVESIDIEWDENQYKDMAVVAKTLGITVDELVYSVFTNWLKDKVTEIKNTSKRGPAGG